jgi:hypothetical protein
VSEAITIGLEIAKHVFPFTGRMNVVEQCSARRLAEQSPPSKSTRRVRGALARWRKAVTYDPLHSSASAGARHPGSLADDHIDSVPWPSEA